METLLGWLLVVSSSMSILISFVGMTGVAHSRLPMPNEAAP